MPTGRGRLGVAAATNGKLYAVGGSEATPASFLNSVEEYDPLADRWTTRTAMPTARDGLGLAASNGKLYAVGGLNDAPTPYFVAVVEAYDPATDTWATRAPMQPASTSPLPP